VIDTQSGITKVTGPRSVATTVAQPDNKLLKKERAASGSYLNAESLELINKSKPREINTPDFENKIVEENDEDSFSHYQEITNEISKNK